MLLENIETNYFRPRISRRGYRQSRSENHLPRQVQVTDRTAAVLAQTPVVRKICNRTYEIVSLHISLLFTRQVGYWHASTLLCAAGCNQSGRREQYVV